MPHLSLLLDALARFARRSFVHSGPNAPTEASDPLDHPAVRRMSLRELADLPLPRPCA